MSVAFQLFKILSGLTRREMSKRTYKRASGEEVELDQTGLMSKQGVKPISEVYRDKAKGVIFANYHTSLAHSFWRAQELTLFDKVRKDFRAPVLDFGCGDGSFSACIFNHIDIGIDIDQEALAAARGLGLYDRLLSFDDIFRDIGDGSVETVFSVSVLEHTHDLTACLREIARILNTTGHFYFSVPNSDFTRQMTELIGSDFADHMNAMMYHRNLLDRAQWSHLLEQAGLQIVSGFAFQPAAFTQGYFSLSLLGKRGFGRIPYLRELFWWFLKSKLIQNVAASICGDAPHGANYFFTARKL